MRSGFSCGMISMLHMNFNIKCGERMSNVRILLSGNTNLQYYIDAVTGVGAEAVAGYLPEIDTSYDGLILCGGNDIDPKYYHQEIDGSVNIDEPRDALEFALLQAYVDAGKPIMGICRGCQLINVYFGGALYQDLPDSSEHTNKKDFYLSHSVTAKEYSFLSLLYGTEFCVNSSHHQAVKELGKGLRATAFWNDKYVEAFEHISRPIIGFQWHPERMCFNEARSDTVDGSKIFEYFVGLCK